MVIYSENCDLNWIWKFWNFNTFICKI